MILDSSTGNLIRETEPKPSERQNSRGEDTEGQIILDSSEPVPFSCFFRRIIRILRWCSPTMATKPQY